MAKKQSAGWSDARRAKFRATLASKKEADVRQSAPEQPKPNGGVMLTVNGRAYPIDEAIAIHDVVERLRANL